ncbi:MAG TPA: TetR/AcrR family transcriptional regulator [Polyangia bacterium]|nr:TetR/AcrR family transcriptional regulator [Polyangia bacterium]
MASRRVDGGLLKRATRTFKQKRAEETYVALLDGAARVFARRGFDGAQTPEIASEAGVSTGAFYRYFDDKRQAFVEMIARSLTRAHADVTAKLDPGRFQGEESRDAIDVAIQVLFEHVKRDAELERVYLAQSLRDPEVEQLRAEFEEMGLDTLEALVDAVIPKEVAPNPRATALVIQIAAIEVASERAGLRPRSGPPLSDEDVKLALREMIHRYLFGGVTEWKKLGKPKIPRRRAATAPRRRPR